MEPQPGNVPLEVETAVVDSEAISRIRQDARDANSSVPFSIRTRRYSIRNRDPKGFDTWQEDLELQANNLATNIHRGTQSVRGVEITISDRKKERMKQELGILESYLRD